MESRWYFFPGQTPENTKIDDRAHALHITQKAWNDITQHLDRKKRLQAALDKEAAYKKALKEGSEAMTKKWKDSAENVGLRKDAERFERAGHKKEDKLELFYKMREEQDAVRKEYVEKMRLKNFLSSGYPKQLTSALILSETLYERDRQREFDEMIKKREEEIERKQAEAIFEKDRKERTEDEEAKKKRGEEDKKVAKILMDQIKQRQATKSEAIRSHIERETQDRLRAAEEDELIKKDEEERKLRSIKEFRAETLKELEANRKMQQQLKKEEEEFEKAVEFYSAAKKKIECMRKQKEKEAKEEAIAHREMLALKVGKEQEDKETAENERIAKVVAERDEADRQKQLAKLEKQERMREERIENRREYLERKKKEQHVDEEVKKWEMLNRLKSDEVMREYDEQNRKDKWRKILEYRKELLEQIEEDRQLQKDEKEIDRMLSRVSFEENDRMFFNYANEVLEYAKSKKRSTYPIEKVIRAYKVDNMLEVEKKERKCLKHGCKNHVNNKNQ